MKSLFLILMICVTGIILCRADDEAGGYPATEESVANAIFAGKDFVDYRNSETKLGKQKKLQEFNARSVRCGSGHNAVFCRLPDDLVLELAELELVLGAESNNDLPNLLVAKFFVPFYGSTGLISQPGYPWTDYPVQTSEYLKKTRQSMGIEDTSVIRVYMPADKDVVMEVSLWKKGMLFKSKDMLMARLVQNGFYHGEAFRSVSEFCRLNNPDYSGSSKAKSGLILLGSAKGVSEIDKILFAPFYYGVNDMNKLRDLFSALKQAPISKSRPYSLAYMASDFAWCLGDWAKKELMRQALLSAVINQDRQAAQSVMRKMEYNDQEKVKQFIKEEPCPMCRGRISSGCENCGEKGRIPVFSGNKSEARAMYSAGFDQILKTLAPVFFAAKSSLDVQPEEVTDRLYNPVYSTWTREVLSIENEVFENAVWQTAFLSALYKTHIEAIERGFRRNDFMRKGDLRILQEVIPDGLPFVVQDIEIRDFNYNVTLALNGKDVGNSGKFSKEALDFIKKQYKIPGELYIPLECKDVENWQKGKILISKGWICDIIVEKSMLIYANESADRCFRFYAEGAYRSFNERTTIENTARKSLSVSYTATPSPKSLCGEQWPFNQKIPNVKNSVAAASDSSDSAGKSADSAGKSADSAVSETTETAKTHDFAVESENANDLSLAMTDIEGPDSGGYTEEQKKEIKPFLECATACRSNPLTSQKLQNLYKKWMSLSPDLKAGFKDEIAICVGAGLLAVGENKYFVNFSGNISDLDGFKQMAFEDCESCLGSGKVNVTCLTCKGTGKCSVCNGTGRFGGKVSSLGTVTKSSSCMSCNGTGHCKSCHGRQLQRNCLKCGGSGHSVSKENCKQIFEEHIQNIQELCK